MNGDEYRDERLRILRMVAQGKLLPEDADEILLALMATPPVERARTSRVSYTCSFCGKSQTEVRRLVAGPGGVYVCNECVGLGQTIIADGIESDGIEAGSIPRLAATEEGRCSFCGKERRNVARLFAGPSGTRICNECLNLCSEIFAEEQGQRPPSPR